MTCHGSDTGLVLINEDANPHVVHVRPLVLKDNTPSPMGTGETIPRCLISPAVVSVDACITKTITVDGVSSSIDGIYPCAENYIANEITNNPTSPMAIALLAWAKKMACAFVPYQPTEAIVTCTTGIVATGFSSTARKPLNATVAYTVGCTEQLPVYISSELTEYATIPIELCSGLLGYAYPVGACIPQ